MSIDALKAQLPDYAKDLKLNLGNVLTTPGLTAQQLWGTAVASAIASLSPPCAARHPGRGAVQSCRMPHSRPPRRRPRSWR